MLSKILDLDNKKEGLENVSLVYAVMLGICVDFQGGKFHRKKLHSMAETGKSLLLIGDAS